jgi:hypothetical protein
MAIAYDTSSNLAASTATANWTHTPTGTPRGVVVAITATGAEATSGVTYGAVSMSSVVSIQSTGEVGSVSIWFLGSGIPTGAQTVEVTRSSGSSYIATAYTVTAAFDTQVVASTSAEDAATAGLNASLTIHSGADVFMAGAAFSGNDALASITSNSDIGGGSPGGDHSNDFGTDTGVINHRTSIYTGTGSAYTGFGWTQTSDDLAYAVAAIKEITFATTDLTVAPVADTSGTVTDYGIADATAETTTSADGFVEDTATADITLSPTPASGGYTDHFTDTAATAVIDPLAEGIVTDSDTAATTTDPSPAADGYATKTVTATAAVSIVVDATPQEIMDEGTATTEARIYPSAEGSVNALIMGFESGTTGWVDAGNATLSVETGIVHSGTQALRITSTDMVNVGYASYPFSGVQPGLYRLSYWKYTPTGGDLSVTLHPAEYPWTYSDWNDQWVHRESVLWVSDPDAYSIRVRVPASGSGYAIIDDLVIEKVTSISKDLENINPGRAPEEAFNIVYPYGFYDPPTMINTVYSRSGFSSLQTIPGSGFVFHPSLLGMRPAHDLTVGAWVYVPSGGAALLESRSYTPGGTISMANTTFDAWEYLEITIPLTHSLTYSTNAFISDTGSTNIYVDSVSAAWTPVPQMATTYQDMEVYTLGSSSEIENEYFYLDWSTLVPPMATVVDTLSHSATQSVFVELPDDEGFTNIWDIPALVGYTNTNMLDPLRTVEISAWVYVPAGQPAVTMLLVDEDLDPVDYHDHILYSATTTTTNQWQQLTVLVDPADIYKTWTETFFISTDGTAAEFYLDDVIYTQEPSTSVQPVTITPVTAADSHVIDVATASSSISLFPVAIGATAEGQRSAIRVPITAYAAGAVYSGSTSQTNETRIINNALAPVQPPQFSTLCLEADVWLNGLTLNTIDSEGVLWVCTDIDGWWNMPDPEVKDYPRGMGDGSYDVQGRWLPRNITLNGVFLPPDSSYVARARDRLIRATNIVHSGAWLRVTEDPLKTSYVRLSGRPSIQTINAKGRTEFSIGLRAADPIKYSWNDADPDGYTSTILPCKSPFNIGTELVTNTGNTAVKTLLQITGPVVGPALIQNVTTGELIIVIGSVDPGSMLEIDTYRQEVALDGETAGMRSMLDPETNWIRLTPGANALSFEDIGNTTNSTAVMTILHRSGWIG